MVWCYQIAYCNTLSEVKRSKHGYSKMVSICLHASFSHHDFLNDWLFVYSGSCFGFESPLSYAKSIHHHHPYPPAANTWGRTWFVWKHTTLPLSLGANRPVDEWFLPILLIKITRHLCSKIFSSSNPSSTSPSITNSFLSGRPVTSFNIT